MSSHWKFNHPVHGVNSRANVSIHLSFHLTRCSSVWRSSRNQCSDFGNYHSIYCASCERDWFIGPAGSLKEWSLNFLSPDGSSGWMQQTKGALPPQCPAFILQQAEAPVCFRVPKSWHCARTPGSTHSAEFHFCWISLRNDDPEVAMKISSVQWISPIPLNMYFKVRS